MTKRKIVACGQRMEPWGDWTPDDAFEFSAPRAVISYYPFHYFSHKTIGAATGTTTRLACRECGDALPTGAQFCVVCGAEVTG